MRSFNKAMLMGNLATDPKPYQTKSGKLKVEFSLAINRETKTSDGQKQEVADFHRIVAWQKLGEICLKFLAKGSAVFVEGDLRVRSYTKESGEVRYITEIVAEDLRILTWIKKDFQENAKNIPFEAEVVA